MAILVPIGQFLKLPMIEQTKYNFAFTEEAFSKNIGRLINQLWKLIPMRENKENWKQHLTSLNLELVGLSKLYNNSVLYISLLSKIEGLLSVETEFPVYRKVVFELISLLKDITK